MSIKDVNSLISPVLKSNNFDSFGLLPLFIFSAFCYSRLTNVTSSFNKETSSTGGKSDESNKDVKNNHFHYISDSSEYTKITLAKEKPLSTKIIDKIDNTGIIIIGIAGGSGSGKTTLSKAIYEAIGPENISYISHDSYYKDLSHLTPAERDQRNFDHPDALDTDLLVAHLAALRQKQNVQIPVYDFSSHTRLACVEFLISRPIVLVEGILIFTDPNLNKMVDIKIFVETDDDIRLIRRIERDTVERGRTIDGVIEQYMQTVRPMHKQFVEPSKANADIIVPVGLNCVALDLLVNKLQNHLATCSS